MKVKSVINHKNMSLLTEGMQMSLLKSMDALKTDLIESETMPFNSGDSQKATFIDDSRLKSGKVRLCHTMPYDRRNYFHPEFNFQTTHNSNAQAMWLEIYVKGSKKTYLSVAYAKFLRGFLNDHTSKH